MSKGIRRSAIASLFLVGVLSGCGPEFQKIGGTLLSKTGYVSQDQAEKVLGAGAALAEPQEDYTPLNEYYLGRAVAATVLSKYKLANDSSLRRYVSKVGLLLAGNSDLPQTYGGYRFFVLDTDEINAMAAPGGFIFVSRGLLKILPDEDALAAVLAHEIGHIVKRHGVNAISGSTRTKSLMQLGQVAASVGAAQVNAPVDVSGLTQSLSEATGEVAGKLIENGYSRSDEYEADEYAVTLLEQTHYDKGGMTEVLEALKKAEATSPKSGWFSTHPAPDDRLGELSSDPVQPNTSGAKATRAQRFRKATGSRG